MAKIIKISYTYILLKETITTESSIEMGSSPNKHNRIYIIAKPLNDKEIQIIEQNDNNKNNKQIAIKLVCEIKKKNGKILRNFLGN